MNALTDLQIIKQGGKPAFAVIPYDAYLELIAVQSQAYTDDDHGDQTIPHEVVGLVVKHGWNLVKAWRKHLGLTQKTVAAKADITQAALSQMERAEGNLHSATLEKLAFAMKLSPEQLRD